MNKKKWALLILVAIFVFGYVKLFYKTYSKTAVAKSADCIIVLDVKRITNTLIWQYITTPSQWKGGRLFSKKDDKVSWKDMFVLPDYVFAFHAKGQPANAWYMLLSIKDKGDFEKGLAQFQFEKISEHEQVSKIQGIRFFIHDNKVLVANAAVTDTAYLAAVANELFTKKAYTPTATLSTAIKAKSHLAVYIAPNDFLQKETVVAANFNKKKIEITGTITAGKQYIFTQNNFKFNSGYLATAGFTQPSEAVYALLSNTHKEKISKALNINIDSVMLQSNKSYSINLAAIKQRADSAITYTYDDEFNKVEKVVINNIQEPAFNFTITGDSIATIYSYFERNNKLEKTAAGDLYTPMPLVKSYCRIKNQKQLSITSANYTAGSEDQSINAVLFLNLALTKIPVDLNKYLPGYVQQAISNLAEVKLLVTKSNEQVLFSAVFEKKKNDLPVIKL